jgi:hypothetical protein
VIAKFSTTSELVKKKFDPHRDDDESHIKLADLSD